MRTWAGVFSLWMDYVCLYLGVVFWMLLEDVYVFIVVSGVYFMFPLWEVAKKEIVDILPIINPRLMYNHLLHCIIRKCIIRFPIWLTFRYIRLYICHKKAYLSLLEQLHILIPNWFVYSLPNNIALKNIGRQQLFYFILFFLITHRFVLTDSLLIDLFPFFLMLVLFGSAEFWMVIVDVL